MRTAIATLIVALAAGTAQAEAEQADAPAAKPEVEADTGADAEVEADQPAEPEVAPEPEAAADSACLGSPVPVRRLGVRGSIWVHLADCKGQPFQVTEQALSALAVPLVPRGEPGAEGGQDHDDELGADALPRINPELLLRLQRVAERYPGRTIEIVSGFRTRASAGSRHRHFDALDIHVEGVSNEELSGFARTLEATGVGYYPNSSFVHLDVREVAAYWVDESGPGEPAKYARKQALAPIAVAGAETDADAVVGADADMDMDASAKVVEPVEPKAEPVAAAKAEDEAKEAPVTAEPASAEPVAADEPAAAERATAEPATAEPATAEPATAEPATAEPATAEPAKAEPSQAEPATAEPVTPQPAKAAPVASPSPDAPQLASIAERALVVMKRALGRAGAQDTGL